MVIDLKTTVVGSYPVPDWLKALPNEQTKVDALVVAMRAQESAGIDVISDGEIGRWNLARNAPGGMVERFVETMAGVQWGLSREQKREFRTRTDMAYRKSPPGVVVGPLGEGLLDLKSEWDQVRSLTGAPLKFTVTSPYMLAKVTADDYYHDLEARVSAFANVLASQVSDIDADILQIDEPNLAGSPQDGALAAGGINHILDTATTRETAVHLCFGNHDGQTIQHGDYANLIDFMNQLQCDHLVLETTRRTPNDLDCLRDVRPEISIGIGVIDVKDLQIESAETVARRIEQLSTLLGEERITYVHPACGLRVLPREVADGKLCALVAGRNLFLDHQEN